MLGVIHSKFFSHIYEKIKDTNSSNIAIDILAMTSVAGAFRCMSDGLLFQFQMMKLTKKIGLK